MQIKALRASAAGREMEIGTGLRLLPAQPSLPAPKNETEEQPRRVAVKGLKHVSVKQ